MVHSGSNAAHALVGALRDEGVRRLASLSGNQILSIYDALIDSGMELIHVRHEAAAVHMADAWGRLTGRPGVALLTAGPGHANGLSALYVAREAESPALVISGHCPRERLGMGGFQEIEQAEMARHVAKLALRVDEPRDVAPAVAEALRVAVSGRPGPVSLSVPGDTLDSHASNSHTPRLLPPQTDDSSSSDSQQTTPRQLSDGQSREVLSAIARALRPLILCGPALCRPVADETLARLSESTGVPLVRTESPRGANDPSLGAFADALRRCDLLLLLGKKLDWSLGFAGTNVLAKDCRILQIDAEPDVLERSRRVAESAGRECQVFHADPIGAAADLAKRAESPHTNASWRQEIADAIAYRPSDWQTLTAPAGEERLHPFQAVRAAAEFLGEDDVFVSDGGEFGQWAQAAIHSRRRIINGPSGSIGGSLPHAVAAKAQFPESRVLLAVGDGAFGFHALEFDTAVRANLPFVCLVGNDACWNAENQLQIRQYGPDRRFGCDLLPTRYDLLVASLGGHGEHVTRAEDLRPVLKRAFDSGLPACVNVAILPEPAPVVQMDNMDNSE